MAQSSPTYALYKLVTNFTQFLKASPLSPRLKAIFLAWKALRGLKSIFWTLFGLGMAVFWTGLWRAWV